MLIVVALVVPKATFAAMLSINPSSGAYKVGDVFTVDVNVSSYTQSMNAVSGVLTYPKDTLYVVSISKNNSLLTTWLPPGATGPVHSVSAGTISFEGVLIGGYTGGPKDVFTVTFKVKKAGIAKLSFKNGTILANDGKGTDLTQSLKTASYKLAAATPAVTGSIKNTKTQTPTKPSKTIAQAQDEKPSVIDITPVSTPVVSTPVVASNPSPTHNFFTEYYNAILLATLGVLILLILMLFVRVGQLTRMVSRLQTQKRSSPRKKISRFSNQKVTSRSKVNNGIFLKSAGNK